MKKNNFFENWNMMAFYALLTAIVLGVFSIAVIINLLINTL
jgi:hypothetical protein